MAWGSRPDCLTGARGTWNWLVGTLVFLPIILARMVRHRERAQGIPPSRPAAAASGPVSWTGTDVVIFFQPKAPPTRGPRTFSLHGKEYVIRVRDGNKTVEEVNTKGQITVNAHESSTANQWLNGPGSANLKEDMNKNTNKEFFCAASLCDPRAEVQDVNGVCPPCVTKIREADVLDACPDCLDKGELHLVSDGMRCQTTDAETEKMNTSTDNSCMSGVSEGFSSGLDMSGVVEEAKDDVKTVDEPENVENLNQGNEPVEKGEEKVVNVNGYLKMKPMNETKDYDRGTEDKDLFQEGANSMKNGIVIREETGTQIGPWPSFPKNRIPGMNAGMEKGRVVRRLQCARCLIWAPFGELYNVTGQDGMDLGKFNPTCGVCVEELCTLNERGEPIHFEVLFQCNVGWCKTEGKRTVSMVKGRHTGCEDCMQQVREASIPAGNNIPIPTNLIGGPQKGKSATNIPTNEGGSHPYPGGKGTSDKGMGKGKGKTMKGKSFGGGKDRDQNGKGGHTGKKGGPGGGPVRTVKFCCFYYRHGWCRNAASCRWVHDLNELGEDIARLIQNGSCSGGCSGSSGSYGNGTSNGSIRVGCERSFFPDGCRHRRAGRHP